MGLVTGPEGVDVVEAERRAVIESGDERLEAVERVRDGGHDVDIGAYVERVGGAQEEKQ